eukprot:4113866-Pleurochrysis_carterae.AAC.1
MPRGAANLGGGGMFRGRPRPKPKELDDPSPALAVVDGWRVSFDVCDWRSCESARRIPVVGAMPVSARVDSGGCISACDVCGWVAVNSRVRELGVTEGVVELENETIFKPPRPTGATGTPPCL